MTKGVHFGGCFRQHLVSLGQQLRDGFFNGKGTGGCWQPVRQPCRDKHGVKHQLGCILPRILARLNICGYHVNRWAAHV